MSSVERLPNVSQGAFPSDHPLLLSAVETVKAACRIARRVQQDLESVRRITKDDRSPVTVADFAVQAAVHMGLAGTESPLRIVGEESAGALRETSQQAVRDAVVEAVREFRSAVTVDDVLAAIDACDHDASGDAYWALDPVDGTKGFLRGQQYAIALARIEGGRVVFGVMGCPNLPLDKTAPLDVADGSGTIYVALRGRGAWQIDPDGGDPTSTASRITVSPSPSAIRTCESVEASHSKQDDTQRILDHMGERGDPVRLDSQCKYAVVARGQADAYLRLPTKRGYVERIWDHAAGAIIATEAGAIVSDITGEPLDFGRGVGLEANRGIVCATPLVHHRIIAAIGALGLGDESSA